jgi:hypothetical protein
MKIQIKARFTDAILFECEISDDTPERDRMREALQKAVSAGANLADANLARANLADANLADANLADANLAGANLAGANFDIKPAPPEEAIANLDKVREIVMENNQRLDMGLWHEDDEWANRSCAEEALCGTTHCLAGWLQVCSTDERVRKLPNPELAGWLAAPIASKMFFESNKRALAWLRDREYAA